ncbi:CopG family transcriptional regulator [Thiohalocapsa halophila]|uniref:CopG family transcriptional regulator n=1 Tax=Thiohalocapsa halophila TaxID=69359 RepID=A0ABS1CGW9_9GAMM|nr:DUF1778 domain-containing protein [Thiohalocapsa halophila]MBK1630626.1 CopG family transcriptional regulator [Thiohalocapsa halophila]
MNHNAVEPQPKRESLNLRVPPEVRDLIDQAARALGKNRTEFILEASCRAAEEALLDRALLRVDEAAFAEFQARLDRPPAPNERLRKTMQAAVPWEHE